MCEEIYLPFTSDCCDPTFCLDEYKSTRRECNHLNAYMKRLH